MKPPFDWNSHGFASPPSFRTAGADGLLVYRCWGNRSTEWGTGYFSLEKPLSVLDAELRFNIVDWGNGVHFVSTFRLKSGFAYWAGPISHGPHDLSRPGVQVYVDGPLRVKLDLRSREILKHDAFVVLPASKPSKQTESN